MIDTVQPTIDFTKNAIYIFDIVPLRGKLTIDSGQSWLNLYVNHACDYIAHKIFYLS